VDLTPDNESEDKGAIDQQLLPYLNSSEAAGQEHLHRLLEKARPIVYRIARSFRQGARIPAYFHTQDIFVDVCIRLLPNLQQCKSDPKQHPISNFAGLVATTTSSVFSDLLRAQDRHQRNLRQKVRRLIAANSNLALWKDDNGGDLICGYAAWKSGVGMGTGAVPSQLELMFGSNVPHKKNTAELVLQVLNNRGRPVKLDELIDLVNIASEGVEVQTVSIDDEHFVQSTPLITLPPDIVGAVDNQRLLHRLFVEIQHLRVEQRKSLLLNMTDSYGYGIEWFLFTKIATEEHLAQLLEVSIEQFRKILNELPMSDAEIARDLGISQSKVMNIRRAVRERLERRRREFLGEDISDSVRLK